MISAEERYPKQYAESEGRRMAYVEVGEGDPILFLHGNPTSSYLWRNIIPYLADLGRCIAPDLIGMGDSEKLERSGPGRYRYVEHRQYLYPLLDALGLRRNVTLVLHDWGSVLGFEWARRHREAIKGIAYMEAIAKPIGWDELPAAMVDTLKAVRSPEGEKLVLDQNILVERILPGAILRKLTDAEMAVYRRPYREAGESRRPTLTWPRQLPIDSEPADVVAVIEENGAFLRNSNIPKLMIRAEPGALMVGKTLDFCRTWPNQQEVMVEGSHFLQEDSPDAIGQALREWLIGLG